MSKERVHICWLKGSYVSRRKDIETIRSSLGSHDLFVYGDGDTPEFIEGQILSDGIFSEERLVMLKAIPAFSGTSKKSNDRWKKIFDSIPDDCLVVIDGVSTGKHQTLSKYVAKNGKMFSYDECIEESDASLWLKEEFKRDKIDVEEEVLALIVRLTGVEYRKGVSEDKLHINVEKIKRYIGTTKSKVSEDDVRKAVDPDPEFVIWELFEAMDSKDLGRARTLVCQSFDCKDPHSAAEYLMSMFMWRYRLITLVKELKEQQTKDAEILKYFETTYKLEKEGTDQSASFQIQVEKGVGKPQYSVGAVKAALYGGPTGSPPINKYGRGELFRIIECLGECALKIRLSTEEIDLVTSIDNVLMTVCKTLKYSSLEALRASTNA